MTRSTRIMKAAGTVTPNARAVFALIASSKCVGCSIGSSAAPPSVVDNPVIREAFIDDLFLTSEHYELAGATDIPTLSDWGQIGMAALLVVGGLAVLRRRRSAM